MKFYQITNDESYKKALGDVAPLVEKEHLSPEESFFLNHQALEIEEWEEAQADIDYHVTYIENLELRKVDYQKQVARRMRQIASLDEQIKRRKRKIERINTKKGGE